MDVNDLTIVLTNFGQTGITWSQGEFTGDGTVDVNDLTIVLANFGDTAGASSRQPCRRTRARNAGAADRRAAGHVGLCVAEAAVAQTDATIDWPKARPFTQPNWRLPSGTLRGSPARQACRYTQTNRYVPISPAPEGRPRVAQRFIAGKKEGKSPRESRRDGRNSARKVTVRPSLRDLRRSIFPIDPAVNCWAIVERPYGTDACCDLCITTSSASGTYGRGELLPPQVFLVGGHRQGVAALVFGVAGVAADVGELEAVAGQQGVELRQRSSFLMSCSLPRSCRQPRAFHFGIHSVNPLPT